MQLVPENLENMRCGYALGNAIHDARVSRFGRDLVCTLWLKEKGCS